MNKLINERLNIEVPENFEILNKEELKAVYLDDVSDRFGVRCEEKHALFAIWWHISNPILTALASDVPSICKATEKKMAKGLRDHGYVLKSFFDTEICGRYCRGFSYEYMVQGKKQLSDAIVLKDENCCYTIYYYSGEENDRENRETFRIFTESFRFEG